MPSKNIKTDFGAVGDTQVLTASVSITSGLKALSSTTGLWASGDVGKGITVPGAAASAGVLFTTIVGFGDAQHITLADAAGATLASSPQMIAWGTDDSAAFQSFKTWAQAQTGEVDLLLPGDTGGYYNPGRFVSGIPVLRVTGTGNPVLANMWLGSDLVFVQSNQCSARIATANPGDTTVRLLDLADVPKFVPGSNTITQSDGLVYVYKQRIKVCDIDMQGFGDPNHFNWEWAVQTGINAGTGLITLAAPLQGKYLSSYPLYNAGGPPGPSQGTDCGGPATIYAFDQHMDCDIEFTGLRLFNPNAAINSPGAKIKFADCVWLDGLGPNPSTNESWTMDASDATACFIEVDKTISDLNVQNGSRVHTLFFQSASTERLNASDSTFDSIQGTPKRANLLRCTIGSLSIGCQAYGHTEQIVADSCVISSIAGFGATDQDVTNNGYTCVNGIIRLTGGPVRWAIPGGACVLQGQKEAEDSFLVTGLAQAAGVTIIGTNLPGTTWPSVPLEGGTRLDIMAHPAPIMCFTNCTGCNDAVNLSQPGAFGKPYGAYSKWSYTGNTFASAYAPHLWGKVVQINITVTKAYTGTQSTLTMNAFGQFGTGATINLKTLGARTITPLATSGAQSGDTLTAAGTGWFFSGPTGPFCSADISGESSSVWPIVTIEVIADQAIPARGAFTCRFS